MSAYIVDKNHIDYLLEAAVTFERGRFNWYHNQEQHQLKGYDDESRRAVGQMLWDENVKSVMARYPSDSPEELPGPGLPTYQYEPANVCWMKMDPVQVLKAVACYEYQSCEHAEWGTSSAQVFVHTLRGIAIRALPGYEAAQWGAPQPQPNTISLTRLLRQKGL